MSPAEIQLKLENKEDILLLDIREPDEIAICQIENSMHIPMMQILNRLDDLPKDKPIVLYCHLGVRSTSVINYLMSNNNYTNLINLDGGIENWAVSLDSSMQRY